MRKLDAAVIGGGPAGMAALLKLKSLGIDSCALFERNQLPGGILDQCIHPGFGLEYFGRELTGPEYAERLLTALRESGAPVFTGTTVAAYRKGRLQTYSRRGGAEEVQAGAVILATGCRERTRENIEVPGTRPAGVYTAGQAQNLINKQGLKLGRRVVIQGSGDIGLIMARRLAIEGYEVAAVLERLPHLSGLIRNKVQCLDHYGIPLHLGTSITEVEGRERVSAVTVRKGREERRIPCDTILFATGLIPELELARTAGVLLPDGFHPRVDRAYHSDRPGLFIAGNSLHINDLADSASREGEAAALSAAAWLAGKRGLPAIRDFSPPYQPPEGRDHLNEDYFQKLRDAQLTPCIICPKGCLLAEGRSGCRRGALYYSQIKRGYRQRLATTLCCRFRGEKRRIPICSQEEIPVSLTAEVKAALEGISRLDDAEFEIPVPGLTVRFRAADLKRAFHSSASFL